MRGELELIKPGKRGKFWVIRGTVHLFIDKDVITKRVEKSTGTTNKNEAIAAKQEMVRILEEEERVSNVVTFREASVRYREGKKYSRREQMMIDRINTYLGDMDIREVSRHDLVAAANSLYPTAKASSKNRLVLTPCASILHYAADDANRWREYVKIKKLDEDEVKTRSTTIQVARKLVKATKGDKRLLILWLFKHGDRITASLNVLGSDIYLKDNYYMRLIGKKKKRWVKASLDAEVKSALIAVHGAKMPQGRIFTWGDRHNVYRWLRPLCKRLKVTFTPHVARHSILSWIGDAGGNEIQIKTKGGHASLKSSERYLASNMKVVSDITAQFPLTKGKSRGKVVKNG